MLLQTDALVGSAVGIYNDEAAGKLIWLALGTVGCFHRWLIALSCHHIVGESEPPLWAYKQGYDAARKVQHSLCSSNARTDGWTRSLNWTRVCARVQLRICALKLVYLLFHHTHQIQSRFLNVIFAVYNWTFLFIIRYYTMPADVFSLKLYTSLTYSPLPM